MKTKYEQLQEKYPSDDPLEILLTWDQEIREKVSEALKPYIRVEHWSGRIQWLVSPALEGDKLAEDIELLSRSVAWELLGFDKQFRLSPAQALELADDIINAQKEGHLVGVVRAIYP